MGNGHWACGTAFAWKMRKFHWIRYQFLDFSHLGTRAHGRVRYRYIHTKCQIPHIFPDESVAGRTIRPCLTFVDLAEFAFKVLQCGLPRAGASWRRDQRNGKTTKTNKDTTTEATAVTARYGKKVRIERIAESLFAAHLVCEMQIKNTQIATQRPAIKRRYELIQLIATAWNCWPQHIPCVACVLVLAETMITIWAANNVNIACDVTFKWQNVNKRLKAGNPGSDAVRNWLATSAHWMRKRLRRWLCKCRNWKSKQKVNKATGGGSGGRT